MPNHVNSDGSVVVHYQLELDAINMMLSNAGESPVSTLENPKNINAIQSRQVLYDSSRDVQLEGWLFNTEYNVKLEPDANTKQIWLPKNTLRADITPYNCNGLSYVAHDIVQRGNKLYDMNAHTDKFNHDVFVNIVYLLSYEELPEAARYYISVKAARRFRQMITGGDDGMGAISQQDEMRARTTLMREDLNGADRGYLSPRRNTLIGLTPARALRRRL